jgi:hypothetical protein
MIPQRIKMHTIKFHHHMQAEDEKIAGIVNISRYFHMIQDKVFNE